MSGFTQDRKTQSLADSIAADLFQMLVEEQWRGEHPGSYGVPRAIWPEFRTKMQLYHEALVLLLLLSEAGDDHRYEEVLRSYEKLILLSTPTPEGLEKLDKLKAAMRDLGSVTSGSDKGRELSWARTWMNNIGHDEWNPATLTLFATHWLDTYIAVARSLKEIAQNVL